MKRKLAVVSVLLFFAVLVAILLFNDFHQSYQVAARLTPTGGSKNQTIISQSNSSSILKNKTPTNETTSPKNRSIIALSIDSGLKYLYNEYNSSVGLVFNSPDNSQLRSTYWLYSDNYLTALSFSMSGNSTLEALSHNIFSSISKYSQNHDTINQYEVLTAPVFGFYASKDFLFYKNGSEEILSTVNNQSSTPLSSSQYADIGFLEAIYYLRTGNKAMAMGAYSNATSTWNGIGFADLPYTSTSSSSYGKYQTYKLALYIYTSRLLNITYDPTALKTLLGLQASDGGFYTCYSQNGSDDGCLTNTETTALCVLALQSLSS